ncbi:hypothetical protein P7C70_g5248, partial [Phenoliferia sp. Uapishka_3]
MSLTTASVEKMFAPLANGNAPAFFHDSVSEDVVWNFGCPGANHMFAGRYEGSNAFISGTFATMAGMMKGPMKISLESSVVAADGKTAAVQVRSEGETKSGLMCDDRACWVIKEEGGVLTEVSGTFDLVSSVLGAPC